VRAGPIKRLKRALFSQGKICYTPSAVSPENRHPGCATCGTGMPDVYSCLQQ
jgi:hypothetical protein